MSRGSVKPLRVRLPILLAGLLVAVGMIDVASAAPVASASDARQADASGTPQANSVSAFRAADFGDLTGWSLNQPLVDMSATSDGKGYWLVAADGGVFSFGDAAYRGSTGNMVLDKPIVGMATDPTTGGYWLVASDGGVFSFDAPFDGSMGGAHLNSPVVGIAAAPNGGGYWLVAADGGVFAFGDAGYRGSTGNMVLDKPIVGMAPDPTTGGYWLVASDGGVFSFDGPFDGSMGGTHLNSPVVGLAAAPNGGGYWLVAADGGVFSFGAAGFEGSALSSTSVPAIGIATAGSDGYWVAYGQSMPFITGGPPPPLAASADGGPGTFAPTGSGRLKGRVVAIDPGHNGDNHTDTAYIDQPVWNGVEEETCDTTGTETDNGYTEAQFNFDVGEYLAADLRSEGATVVLTRTTNTGIGPCVTERAAIGNQAQADAAVAIHADGGPADGRGYAVLEPVADGINNAIIGPSATLGSDLQSGFGAATGEAVSDYQGIDGIEPRNDLGGLNLSVVPKVFIECANMRNVIDATLVTSSSWQAAVAVGIADGISNFLTG